MQVAGVTLYSVFTRAFAIWISYPDYNDNEEDNVEGDVYNWHTYNDNLINSSHGVVSKLGEKEWANCMPSCYSNQNSHRDQSIFILK